MLILGRCKLAEERGFYLRLAIDQRWSTRELERQLEGALFERSLCPTLVADYQTKLPDKAVLEAKLDELFAMLDREEDGGDP